MDCQPASPSLSLSSGFHGSFKKASSTFLGDVIYWLAGSCGLCVCATPVAKTKMSEGMEEQWSYEKHLRASLGEPSISPEESNTTQYCCAATQMRFSYINAIVDLRRSHCGQSVSSGSRGMSPQTGVLGGPCRQPQSCCLEVTSSPPFWLQVSPPVHKYRGKKRDTSRKLQIKKRYPVEEKMCFCEEHWFKKLITLLHLLGHYFWFVVHYLWGLRQSFLRGILWSENKQS